MEIFSKSKIKFVDTLSHKKLSVGMKLLGAVKEVNELDVAVSLPNGLSGFVHITRINEKITASLKGELQAADTDVEQVRPPFPDCRGGGGVRRQCFLHVAIKCSNN